MRGRQRSSLTAGTSWLLASAAIVGAPAVLVSDVHAFGGVCVGSVAPCSPQRGRGRDHPGRWHACDRPGNVRSTTTTLSAASDSDNESSGGANTEASPLFDPSSAPPPLPSNFNPFQQAASTTTSSSQSTTTAGISTAGTPLSLRTMKMKTITGELYQYNTSPTKMRDILDQNVDFLVEQLVDADAVLDVGSVYTADMELDVRRERYAEVMEGRIGDARSGEVKRVLVALRDFVLGEVDRRRGGGGEGGDDDDAV